MASMLSRFLSEHSSIEVLALSEIAREDITIDGFVLVEIPDDEIKTVEQLAQHMDRRTSANVFKNAKENFHNIEVVSWMSRDPRCQH